MENAHTCIVLSQYKSTEGSLQIASHSLDSVLQRLLFLMFKSSSCNCQERLFYQMYENLGRDYIAILTFILDLIFLYL